MDGVAVENKAEIVARLSFLATQRPDFDTSGQRPTTTVFTFEEFDPGAVVAPAARQEERPGNTGALPLPWEERVSRSSGEVYYFNSETGESTYSRPGAAPADPRGLPAPWEERVSRSSGEVYYFNPQTDESTYDRPTSDHKEQHDDKKQLQQHELFTSQDDEVATSTRVPGSSDIEVTQRREASLLSPDASLPAGWTARQSRSTGDTYYLNLLTAESMYEKPTQPALAPREHTDIATDQLSYRDAAPREHTDIGASAVEASSVIRSPKRTRSLITDRVSIRADADTDGSRDELRVRSDQASSNPLRTVQELLRRHQAATVFQSHWRGKIGRRNVDTAMSFALFRRFADRDEVTIGADGQRVVLGPALRHRKCNELLALCDLDETGRGVAAHRCVPRNFSTCHEKLRGLPTALWQEPAASGCRRVLGFQWAEQDGTTRVRVVHGGAVTLPSGARPELAIPRRELQGRI